jgi:hypothetical protein
MKNNLTQKEKNYLYLLFLVTGIAIGAVATYFNREFTKMAFMVYGAFALGNLGLGRFDSAKRQGALLLGLAIGAVLITLFLK